MNSTSSIIAASTLLLAGIGCEPQTDQKTSASEPAASQEPVSVEVGKMGYKPEKIQAKAGEPLTLLFTRTSDEGCGEKLVFPDRSIEKELPLGKEVEIELTPQADETISFTCGMGMYKGSIVAKPGA